jgi:hypothetical protein
MPWQAITALWPVVAAVSEAWPRSSELYPASQACLIKCQFVTQSSTAMMTSQNRSSLETRWRQMCGFKTQRLPSTSPAKTMSLPSSASTECESNRTPSVRIASGSRACCFEFSRPQSTCILCTAAAAVFGQCNIPRVCARPRVDVVPCDAMCRTCVPRMLTSVRVLPCSAFFEPRSCEHVGLRNEGELTGSWKIATIASLTCTERPFIACVRGTRCHCFARIPVLAQSHVYTLLIYAPRHAK